MKTNIAIAVLAFGMTAKAELPTFVNASYRQPNAFFYQIEKAGATSFILGSMHLGIPLHTYPSEIFSRADAAKIFVSEGDPFEITPAQRALQKKIVRYSLGNSLEKNISAKAYLKLVEIFGQQQIDRLKAYTPAVFSVLFSNKLMESLNPDGLDPLYDIQSGIDLTLLREAQEKQKQILFLDDRTQIILDSNQAMSAEDLESMLQYKNPIAYQLECINYVQRSYLEGDEGGLQKYMAKCVGKGLTTTLLKRTNQWITKLQAPLMKGNSFIVVGVTHLLGPKGLLVKLQADGYRVRRVSSAAADSTLLYFLEK